jgi:hypothetical protein
VTVAWLIVANKPIYPLYVWWFVGSGVTASLATILAAPLFAAIAWGAPRAPRDARIALPLVGLLDTLFATKLFGPAGGTELFLVPCALLAVVALPATDKVWSRALIAAIFLAFAATHGRYGVPLHGWTGEEPARLAEVNIWAVASLTAFVGWRFAGLGRS